MSSGPYSFRPGLTVTTEVGAAQVCVVVVGEVDLSTADVLGQRLEEAQALDRPAVIVDLAGVTFLGSTGITVLVKAYRRAVKAGGRLRVINPEPNVRRVLDVVGVLEYLTGEG